ncbi:MAG: peptidylprolyl isomerase [Gemmatimonadales bacterium]
MRRLWLALSLVSLAGCDNVRDLFTAHADVAAQAAGQELSAETLAGVMAQTKGLQVNRDAAEFVANVWIDYTLLAQAVVHGTSLRDSTAIAEMMWPQIAMIKGDRLFDTVLAERLNLTDAAADSVYNGDQLRMVQHILYGAPPSADAPAKAEARRKAEATLARLKRGASFSGIAAEESQDFQTARDSGFLPPSPRGAYVTAFDSAAWLLPPGGMSGIVQTPFGYHIIHRPTAEESRPRILAYLEQNLSSQLDSLFRDSISTANDLKLTGSAVATMRAALSDMEGQRNSRKKIVEWRGGGLTVADFLRWVFALPPQATAQLRQVQDDQLKEIATLFAQNALILDRANAMHLTPTPEQWAGMVQQYRITMDSLLGAVGIGSALTDTSVTVGEREKLAALRVDTYLQNVSAGKARLRPVPPTLTSWLRTKAKARLNEAGLIRAVELAQAQKTQADSASAGRATPIPVPGDSGRRPTPLGQ